MAVCKSCHNGQERVLPKGGLRWLTVGLVGHTGRRVGIDGVVLDVQCTQPVGGVQVGPDLDFGACQAARGGR